jgi:predicted dehydrogenase
MTRALIVGCGRIAGGNNEADESAITSHVRALRWAGATVVGCIDREAERARAFAARWSLPRHGTDLAAALERDTPDLVVDCTPPAARLEVVRTALGARATRALLLEKPLGRTAEEASLLLAAVRASGLPVLVNYQRAFDPCYRQAAVLVRDGRLGRLERVVALAYGGALANMSHLIERSCAMFGRVAEAGLIAPPLVEDADDPALSFRARFERGVEGIFLGLPRGGPALIELDLIGSEARLRLVDSERRVEFGQALPSADGLARAVVPLAPSPLPAPDWEAIRHVAAAAVAAVHAPAFDDGLIERAAEAVMLIDGLRRTGGYVARGAA